MTTTLGAPLKITVITARDLPEAWWECIREVLHIGRKYTISEGSYAGQERKELDLVVVEVEHPGTRPIVPTVPDGFPAPTSMEYIEKTYLPYLTASIARMPNEEYTYGEDIEPQLLAGIEIYKRGFDTNKVCFSVGNRDSIKLASSQCLRVVDTRISNGKLHFIAYLRSWDLVAGFPSNLAGLQLMKEMMAQELGVEDGALIAISKGLHLYDHHWRLGAQITGLEEKEWTRRR